jgi:hypothetical protein
MKNFVQFVTQMESDYQQLVSYVGKFKLIDALFAKYNTMMGQEQLSKEQKETLISIMRNFIEYYKKLNISMKNAYYTYESGKEMIMEVEDYVKLNQKSRRTLHLHEGFEDMGKNNKYDFINQMKAFLQTFHEYHAKLHDGLPKVLAMLQYVENYDNLRLYVEEFIKYTQIEKYYSEYEKQIQELSVKHREEKNRDPNQYEPQICEILDAERKENVQCDIKMEINKIDIIHQLLRLLNEEKEKPSSPKVEEKKRGRKKKTEQEAKEKSESYVNPNIKMMIFSDFSSIFKKITPLCDMLNIKYVQLDGGNMRSIEHAVKQYKMEDAQILFCDSTLFGCGMNFENTTHVLFTHTPNPEMMTQIIGRAQRIGRTSILQVYQLHYPNEEIYSVIKKDADAHMFHFMTVMRDGSNEVVQKKEEEEEDDFEGGESSI